MKSTVTAAMETILALPPVNVSIKARAFFTTDRLGQNGWWTPNFVAGHGRIREVISDPISDMPRERTLPMLDFSRNFETVFPDRLEWLQSWPRGLPANGLVTRRPSPGPTHRRVQEVPKPRRSEKQDHIGMGAGTLRC